MFTESLYLSHYLSLAIFCPQCVHCQQLEPNWVKLAKMFTGDTGVVFAKLDATANDIQVPGLEIEGYPTLVIFPAGANKTHIVYDENSMGLRTMQRFVNLFRKTPRPVKTAPAAAGKGKDEL